MQIVLLLAMIVVVSCQTEGVGDNAENIGDSDYTDTADMTDNADTPAGDKNRFLGLSSFFKNEEYPNENKPQKQYDYEPQKQYDYDYKPMMVKPPIKVSKVVKPVKYPGKPEYYKPVKPVVPIKPANAEYYKPSKPLVPGKPTVYKKPIHKKPNYQPYGQKYKYYTTTMRPINIMVNLPAVPAVSSQVAKKVPPVPLPVPVPIPVLLPVSTRPTTTTPVYTTPSYYGYQNASTAYSTPTPYSYTTPYPNLPPPPYPTAPQPYPAAPQPYPTASTPYVTTPAPYHAGATPNIPTLPGLNLPGLPPLPLPLPPNPLNLTNLTNPLNLPNLLNLQNPLNLQNLPNPLPNLPIPSLPILNPPSNSKTMESNLEDIDGIV